MLFGLTKVLIDTLVKRCVLEVIFSFMLFEEKYWNKVLHDFTFELLYNFKFEWICQLFIFICQVGLDSFRLVYYKTLYLIQILHICDKFTELFGSFYQNRYL